MTPQYPRRFALIRDQDVTGVSGTGTVAYGLELPDGRAVVAWVTGLPSTVVWPAPDGMTAVRAIHGHDGRTRVVYLDPAPTTPAARTGPNAHWSINANLTQPDGTLEPFLHVRGSALTRLDRVMIGRWLDIEVLTLDASKYSVRVGPWRANVHVINDAASVTLADREPR